jgi:hypothetical protein
MSPEVLQQFDLAQCALGKNLFAEDIGDLLNGDTLVRLVVHGSTVRSRNVSNGSAKIKTFSKDLRISGLVPDNAISALAKLLCDGVALIDDEVLVEHLEHLAALKVSHDEYLSSQLVVGFDKKQATALRVE